ncbi:hypothetical protein CMV_010067 [Castanea mollissima]|uniref:Uncharacterized protein n=1 Tax=Castanea mollissima TaxID=60419 RepID=A0A8J4R616_9ROSI|nr:hypothetical protein CMV_010067 [Castanea mollissima]
MLVHNKKKVSPNFTQHSHTTLKNLRLEGWAKLNSLPGEIQQFTALETLVIEGFDEIETLAEWLGNLSSLKKLYIWKCNNLMYLPTTTTRLIKLEELHIRGCSKLKERCVEGSGAEWLKIAHIPKIDIDGREINKEDAETQHCPNQISNDVLVGYSMVVMQMGKELKCINVQNKFRSNGSITLYHHHTSNLSLFHSSSMSEVEDTAHIMIVIEVGFLKALNLFRSLQTSTS